MGYETSFSLQLIDTTSKNRKFTAEWLKEIKLAERYDCDWKLNKYGIFRLSNGEGYRWYDHHEEMIEISRQHQTVVFILDGVGESSLDVWRKFYLAGASYKWKLVVEPPSWGEEIHQKLVVESIMEDQ